MKWKVVRMGILALLIFIAYVIPLCQATIEKEFDEYYYYDFLLLR